jgi:molybdopterin converting factor small subunit
MINVRIKYFAILREQRGIDEEIVSTRAINPIQLYLEIATKHKFTLAPDRIRAAVNDEFVTQDYALVDGDSIVFLPPMAGG